MVTSSMNALRNSSSTAGTSVVRVVVNTSRIVSGPLRLVSLRLTSIVGLFQACCPSAVTLRVTKVVVLTVQCQAGWRLAHVGKEILEPIPLRVYCDTTSTVVLIASCFRVGATG